MTTLIYRIKPHVREGSHPDALSVYVVGDETEENFQNIFHLVTDAIGLPRAMTETKNLVKQPGYEGLAYLPSSHTARLDKNYLRNLNNKAALAAQVILDQGKEVRLYLYGNSPEKDTFAFKPIGAHLV